MILKNLIRGLGIFNDSDKYPQSIFYTQWNNAQSLADIDYMLSA